MTNSYRKARVLVNGVYSGIIEETDRGYQFQYDQTYIDQNRPAVSLTLPVRSKPYHSRTLFPFFDGLIPEGYLLHLVEKNWKLNATDRFGILCVACKDSIGDVSIYPVLESNQEYEEDNE